MDSVKKLLMGNKAWVLDKLSVHPDFFARQAESQQPEFLWIGCSDSRVPADEITGSEPGELFVHRNIANLVIHTDFNMLSVLQYAVEVLKVKHIIVCGHYNCGGIANAMTHSDLGLINKWLRHIKDVYRIYEREINMIADPQARYDRFVELNVIEQTRNIARTSFVQRVWAEGGQLLVHGWVYDVRTGYLNTISCLEAGFGLDDIYTFDFGEPPAPSPGPSR